MNKLLLTLSFVCFTAVLKAQNIFPVKLDNCQTSMFCMDCGDTKANVEPQAFAEMIADINKTTSLGNASGKILLQVLVDSTGTGCVLSHTDMSKSSITKNVIKHFNNFKGWVPAKTGNVTVGRVSINVIVEVSNGELNSHIQRVDMNAFAKSFDHPVDPEIYNKKYSYKNEHLKNYKISVWNTSNSKYADNFNDYLAIDNNNLVWFPTKKGIMQFNGTDFTEIENKVDTSSRFRYYLIGVSNNEKWTTRNDIIYSYNDKQWTTLNSQSLGIDELYSLHSGKDGEMFFCAKNGLHIYKEGKWTTINSENTPGLGPGSVYFAKRDSKNRLWIGTFRGSVMIDANGKVTIFNDGSTLLKGRCITSLDEDEDGNLYFALYEYAPKDKTQVNRDEGIAMLNKAGEFKLYNTDNSGMPINHASKILYDRSDKVLWITTERAGLVRYDLKGGWEVYNNKNSDIPTSSATNMAFDKNGVLYITTRQGLVRLERN